MNLDFGPMKLVYKCDYFKGITGECGQEAGVISSKGQTDNGGSGYDEIPDKTLPCMSMNT